jgi:hypothetical protein
METQPSYVLSALLNNTFNLLGKLVAEHLEEVPGFFRALVDQFGEEMADALERAGYTVTMED